MNRRKPDISQRYRLGILVVLVMLCLGVSIGVTYGRYRAQSVDNLPFVAGGLEQVYLGREVSEEGTLDTAPATWTLENGVYTMEFILSNGISASEYATEAQEVSVSLLAGMALTNGDSGAKVELIVISDEDEETFEGTAVPILEGSSLRSKFGEGWVFRFFDADGEEMTWQLSGEERSMIRMQIKLGDAEFAGACQLQLQVSGD